jgi:hypothetical protein
MLGRKIYALGLFCSAYGSASCGERHLGRSSDFASSSKYTDKVGNATVTERGQAP